MNSVYSNMTIEDVMLMILNKMGTNQCPLDRHIPKIIALADPITEADVIQNCLVINDYLRFKGRRI